jgi:NAD(P) transhydrogenase subunit alpha
VQIGVPKETTQGESRVALVPDVIRRLSGAGHQVVIEAGAGLAAGHADAAYADSGATIADASAVWASPVVAKVGAPTAAEVGSLQRGGVLVGFLAPLSNPDGIRAIAGSGATAFAMEAIPRTTRAQSMDALSSQATVSGYRAVLIGTTYLGRFFPMLMTAAGTVPPANVFVLGAGVAGLQAIATGGYARELTQEELAAQRAALAAQVAKSDVVITTALVPGRPAPKLVTADAVAAMKRGSVVVDLAGEAGGNCELTRPGQAFETDNGVHIVAPLNVPSTMAEHASQLYAKNVQALLELMTGEDGALKLDFEDDIIAGACVTRDGDIVHPGARSAAGLA